MNLIPTHGVLRMWTDLYGPHTEAPVEAHLGAAIAMISAAIGWKAHIRWAGNGEPATVNVILEGGSAVAKKTTVANTAHRLAREACGDQPDEYRRLFTHTLSHTSDAGLLELIAPQDTDEAARWEASPPPGHLIVWDEFGGILGDPGMQRKGSDWLGRVRTTIMQIANGRQSGSTTRSMQRPSSRCAVSILATMTRVELEERVDTGLLRDGFLGRFALIPLSGHAPILATPPLWTPGMIQQHDAISGWLRRLADRSDVYGEAFELLTPTAHALRTEWYTTMTTELRANAERSQTQGATAKLEAFGRLQTLAMKIALVHSISRLNDPLDTLSVDEEAVDYGQTIAIRCLAEIEDLANDATKAHPSDDWQTRFLEWLTDQPDETATKRDIDRSCQSRRLSPAQRWMLVEDLHASGSVEITKAKLANGRSQIRVNRLSDMSYTQQAANGNGNLADSQHDQKPRLTLHDSQKP